MAHYFKHVQELNYETYFIWILPYFKDLGIESSFLKLFLIFLLSCGHTKEIIPAGATLKTTLNATSARAENMICEKVQKAVKNN